VIAIDPATRKRTSVEALPVSRHADPMITLWKNVSALEKSSRRLAPSTCWHAIIFLVPGRALAAECQLSSRPFANPPCTQKSMRSSDCAKRLMKRASPP